MGDDTDRAATEPVPVGPMDVPGQLRRRAAHLYGLIEQIEELGLQLVSVTQTKKVET